jgi:monoamine oxidase
MVRGSTKIDKRVLVVGAGFAGAACAHELAAAGYDVHVIEGRDRIGGRVYTSQTLAKGRIVEIGAELIGSNHPLWLAYAKKFRLTLRPLGDDDSPISIRIKGEKYEGEKARAILDQMDVGHKKLAELAAAVPFDKPWTLKEAGALDRKPFADQIKSLGLESLPTDAILTEFMMDMASSPQEMSSLGLLAIINAHGCYDYWRHTEDFRCAEGNQQLAARLLESIGANGVTLGKRIVEIDISSKPARVRMDDGTIFSADEIVLTAPPSTWDQIKFMPALPPNTLPTMGKAVKFMGVLTSRYWEARRQTVDSMGDDTLGMTWEGTAGQEGDGPVVLTSFVGGDPVDTLSKLTPPSARESFHHGFDKVAPGFRSSLVADEYLDWMAEPLTRTGYACPSPGQVTTVWQTVDNLPGPLHIAGEHAALGFTGFMEGGLFSGARVARRIALKDGLVRD